MRTVYRVVALGILMLSAPAAYAQRTVLDFNKDWRFAKGEHGEASRGLDFDDSSWQVVRLPHDWAIAGPWYGAAPSRASRGWDQYRTDGRLGQEAPRGPLDPRPRYRRPQNACAGQGISTAIVR